MDLRVSHSAKIEPAAISISGSKSETNRLLLLQSLYGNLELKNISDSEDSKAMMRGLASKEDVMDVHHAGTAMRFLTAFFAIQENRRVIVTGSERMKQRPIGILVDALRELGAVVDYVENEGFPPLRIIGKKLSGREISLRADTSSQYVSALLMIGPKLQNGLKLTLDGGITSAPYIKMTLAMLDEIGIRTAFIANAVSVEPAPTNLKYRTMVVESDWSSASYFYSIVAMSDTGTQISLSSFNRNSRQGDSALVELYRDFGVATEFDAEKMTIKKAKATLAHIDFDLNGTPDLAQTIAVTCLGLGVSCRLTGLQTLKIKETDRLQALQNEMKKLGASFSITQDSLILQSASRINPNIRIATYNDHRMAMAFAPLAIKVPIVIENADVVCKSYANFWNDLQTVGFELANL